MRYSNLTHKSNIFLKRFTHSSRHLRSSNIVNKIKFKTFLDFGTGDGQFFEFLTVKPNKKYFAYEPYKEMYLQFLKNKKKFNHVNIIKNKNNLKKNFYDVITVNEVIEHLNDTGILRLLKF